MSKLKKQPTVVNGYWCMTWIENGMICQRNMKLIEMIRYLPRMMFQEWVTGYKFPKI